MNPIKNKKDLETTINEIRKFAYAYLEKYSPFKTAIKNLPVQKIFKKKIKKYPTKKNYLI